MNNIKLNDEEIEFLMGLIHAYREAYCIPDVRHEPDTIYAHLKRMERKLAKALEASETEFV